ncbi:conserved hypothetical protein [Nitrosotalea sinensis]|jgi:hypothetical protein|uniref:Uncharacterized protein n=1 Tax=Nitrosotalea sinensis TaxID=1499975 RepID=A0A2H1EJ12_9ARCH|nr:hypothetical protein [Candidatus Nitrosotalea sinensis]SHO48047.1 conserved hypothetical protein [Candidatus Nitrosotalea sinensis]
MREDLTFEITRAYDLLPHVVGASWASIWFRINKIRRPTKEQFREKVVEYFNMLELLTNAFPQDAMFKEMTDYTKYKHADEIRKILTGNNSEIEKRYKRYIDYG